MFINSINTILDIIMRAKEFIFEQEKIPGVSNYAVVMGGRFQPPHKGHYAIYKFLTRHFNTNNVFIATSNKTDKEAIDKYNKNLEEYKKKYDLYLEKKSKAEEKGNKIPPEPKLPNPPQVKSYFNYNEKAFLWNKLFNVSNVKFSATPAFNPIEILNSLPDDTAYITVTSEKDKERFEGKKFYKPYPMNGNIPMPFEKIKDTLFPYKDYGYYIILPSLEGGISATKIRDFIQNNKKSYDEKYEFLKKLYGRENKESFNLIISRLGGNWGK